MSAVFGLVGRTIVAVYEQPNEAAFLLDNDDIVRFRVRADELLYRIDIPAMGNPGAADELRARIEAAGG